MLVVIVIGWCLNFKSIFNRELIEFGFVNKILLRLIFLYLVEELKIYLMFFGFFGWYIVNSGKY